MPPNNDDNWTNVVYPPRARVTRAAVEPPRAFKSAIFAGIMSLLAILAALPPYIRWSSGMPEARTPSYIFGRYILWPFVFAGVLGWVACRVRNRSKAAFNITFGLILLLILLTNRDRPRNAGLSNPTAMKEIDGFVAEAEKIKSEMRELEASGQLENVSASTLQAQLDRMEAVIQKGTGEAGRVMRASFAVPRKLLQAQIRSKAPLERFKELGGLETSGITSKKQIEDRLAAIREYKKHITEALAITKDWRSIMVEGGKAEGFSATQVTQMIGLEGPLLDARMKTTRSVHELEVDAADCLRRVLELLRDEWGQWQVDDDDNALVFEDDVASEKYNKLLDRLGEIEEKQTNLIKRALQPRG